MSWITVDANSLQLESIKHSREGAGGTVVSRPSPLDVPEAFQIEVHPESRMVVLRFKYITNESIRELSGLTSSVQILRGKASGRIYEIQIKVPEPFNLDSLRAAVQDTSHELLEKSSVDRGGPERATIFRNRIAGQIVDRAPSLVTSMNLRY